MRAISGLISLARRLLVDRTDDGLTQLFRTCVVGVISLVVDMGVLVALTEGGIWYIASAAAGFCVSLAVNYLLTRRFVFTYTSVPLGAELVIYAAIAAIGLGLTELLLFLFVERVGMHYAPAKFISAVIVLGWTFTARKKILYRIGPRM